MPSVLVEIKGCFCTDRSTACVALQRGIAMESREDALTEQRLKGSLDAMIFASGHETLQLFKWTFGPERDHLHLITRDAEGIIEAPQFPAGPFQPPAARDMQLVRAAIATLDEQRTRLRAAVEGLSAEQLNTRYRNWTIRQIASHIADNITNDYVRWKLALTEERPSIKPFDETAWAALPDSTESDVMTSVALLDAAVARMLVLMRSMKESDFDRSYIHPQYEREIPLWHAVALYAWHTGHHLAQIDWVRAHRFT